MSEREVVEMERRRESIKAQLAAVGDLRRGSLVERYRKCGKGNCCCAAEEGGGHGPSWSLTWREEARTRGRAPRSSRPRRWRPLERRSRNFVVSAA